MADEADRAALEEQALTEELVRRARTRAVLPGAPGICERCDEPSPRLVGGACVAGRELFKLP